MTNLFHVEGTVDDDELLSLRFGHALGEDLPDYVERQLCDTFWTGDMSVALIETFSRGNRIIDFKLTLDIGMWRGPVLMAVEADGWPIDAREVGKELRLHSVMVLCHHDLQRIAQVADRPSDEQEEGNDGRRTPDHSGVR